MKFCVRCDQPIRDDEEYTEHDKFATSGAGTTVYRHVAPCQRAKTQTSPVPTIRRYR